LRDWRPSISTFSLEIDLGVYVGFVGKVLSHQELIELNRFSPCDPMFYEGESYVKHISSE